ncbi:uncharacterized protein LOC116976515 [Tachysurus ichikawai]
MFMLFVSIIVQNVNTLLVYDRQTLLDLRLRAKDFVKFDSAYLCRLPASYSRGKRYRRRGKRSGQMVRVKAFLAHFSMASWREFKAVPRVNISWRLLDHVDWGLVPVVSSDKALQPRAPCSPRPRLRGVNQQDLRHLCRVPRTFSTADPPAPVRIGLVNARSLANKTFVLKDFFTFQGLDFLCVTETWLRVGETSALSELLPHDCCYVNSP